MGAREIVTALGGRWHGSYGQASCPAHVDDNPSLSISNGKDGRLLWHCHSGCSQDAVKDALRARGLLEDVDCTSKTRKADRKIDEVYDYLGPGGQLFFQVVRYHPKGFSQRRPDGKGGWISNLKGVQRVPYRLPDLLQAGANPVFVVEGEKDADRLAELGLVATCNPGGADKWRDDYNPYFKCKQVVILPDNDAPGHEHARNVAASLDGVAYEIKIVELPGLKAKGDVSDWLAAGGGRAELLPICDAAPVWETDPGNWYAEVQTGAKGGVLCNHANAMLALRRDPAWCEVFGYDEMRGQVMLLRPVPRAGQPPEAPFPHPVPWIDENDAQAQEYLQLMGFPQLGKVVVATAISQRAAELRYHPVRDYLNSLKWDGIPRIKGGLTAEGDTLNCFFVSYFGANDTRYAGAIGSMFLVAAVARIMKPGCKADHVPILEGQQGIGKSTSLRILVSEVYFSDGLPEIGSKDATDHLRGKWLIEIAELDAMTRAEDTAFKAFITRQVDKYRPAYGRREIESPRQCIFMGTTNRSAYLKDETGGRRYWPVRCGYIDLAALEQDRDQIWAEAVHLFRNGCGWHITEPSLLREAEVEQHARYDVDVWEDKIAEYVVSKTEVSVSEIMERALRIEIPRMDRAGQNRVMKILRRLGWGSDGRMAGGRTAWVRQVPND